MCGVRSPVLRYSVVPLQTDSSTVCTSIVRITVIQRIITVQSLRTSQPHEPSTEGSILGNADPRGIARHAAVGRQPGIVLAPGPPAANVRPGREAAALVVLVLELAVARAAAGVRAVGVVGDALHVEGAGGHLEAAGTADFGLGEGQGGDEGEEHGLEEHFDGGI
jgi:hypothetical protein